MRVERRKKYQYQYVITFSREDLKWLKDNTDGTARGICEKIKKGLEDFFGLWKG